MTTHRLIDTDAMKAHHRTTFMIPSDREKASLRVGDHINVGFIFEDSTGRHERIWLRVSAVRGRQISGILENDPVYVRAALGDKIQLELRHVLAIERPSAYPAAA
jgi:hypothetical protein